MVIKGLPQGSPIHVVCRQQFRLEFLQRYDMKMHFVLSQIGADYMRVAMICFFAGVLLILVGWLIWKNNKPEYLVGYKKIEHEDTRTFAKLAGQAHMLGGAGMVLLSFPLNEESPNPVFAVSMLVCSLVLIVMAFVRYRQALKSRRKK